MMTKHYLQKDKEEEVELSKFEILLQVCDSARDEYYQEKFQGTKQNDITASVHASSAPKDVGTCSFLVPPGWVSNGEQVPKRLRSKATRGRGEVSLADGFCKLNLKGDVDDHDYLNDKEVPSSLCKFNGKRCADDHDYLNDKKVLIDVKGKKKLRNYYDSDEEDYEYSEKEEKPRKNIVKKNKVVEIAVPLAIEFENRIREMGGYDVKLVIQKELFDSDIDKTQNRFSIPIKQIRQDAKDFLTENEISGLPSTVPFIEPNLDLAWITFRKWNYGSSSSYALSGPWSGISKKNNLRAEMVMQLWSFRVDGKLFLALVQVSRDNEQDHVISGIANTSQTHAESNAMEQINSGNQADGQGARACRSQAKGCRSNQLNEID